LKAAGVETHLVLSRWGQRTVEHETGLTFADLESRASVVHGSGNMAATISSGSFRTDGMVICPCTMRTVATIANGNGENLVHRAADVVLKERRRLVIVPRETPLSEIHLENLLKLARMGVAIVPPMPAFYNKPATLDDMVDHIVARVLDQFDIDAAFARRWDGVMHASKPTLRRA
jgi:4-hydroxy-3-polyprenylbenzoate decarboxylase